MAIGSAAVPVRLRPTGPFAADAVLAGDPGRSLLLAQELLEQPKMSNHARGLWGYSGTTPAGSPLTIQATGIGGPSAALVLGDLAELGVRRVIRVGTCLAAPEGPPLGALLIVEGAIAEGGSAVSFGVAVGESVAPDPGLTARLREMLGDARTGVVASFDSAPEPAPGCLPRRSPPTCRRSPSWHGHGRWASPRRRCWWSSGRPASRRSRIRSETRRCDAPGRPPRPYSHPKV